MKSFQNGDFSLLEDIPFKDTFGRKTRKAFSKYLLEVCLKEKIDDVQVLSDATLEKFSFHDKEYQADIVMQTNEVIYNFEAFTSFSKIGLLKTQSYGERLFSTQLQIGDSYESLKKIVQFVIIDRVHVSLKKKFYTKNLFESESTLFSDYHEIHVIRLDLIEKAKYNEGENDISFLKLMKFIRAKNQKERDKIVMEGEDKMLGEINEFVKRFSKNKCAKEKYEGYQYTTVLARDEARREGREIGLREGRMEGHKEGHMEGLLEGREESNRKFARYLVSSGKNVEEISNTMEISVSEVKRLLEN